VGDQEVQDGSNVKRLGALALVVAGAWVIGAQQLPLPNRPASLKFAAIGDNGTGDSLEYDIGRQMAAYHGRFPFELVIMLGDNLYGRQTPEDFVNKFETPFRPLLDAGVRFYAALGNHDNQSEELRYPAFNMGGARYYTYVKRNVRFFVIDSDLLDPQQLAWIQKALTNSMDDWKICYFHHPLYSDGKTHGSQVELRVTLEPLFIAHGVNVVFSGHDHIYERLKPQKGITYFVSGAGGQLRKGDVRRSEMTAAAFDQDCSFMLIEVAGDDLYFQAISRSGATVDSGTVHRQSRS
jgi:3',5'-cyclic AMP phosphodiesterase CpdA